VKARFGLSLNTKSSRCMRNSPAAFSDGCMLCFFKETPRLRARVRGFAVAPDNPSPPACNEIVFWKRYLPPHLEDPALEILGFRGRGQDRVIASLGAVLDLPQLDAGVLGRILHNLQEGVRFIFIILILSSIFLKLIYLLKSFFIKLNNIIKKKHIN